MMFIFTTIPEYAKTVSAPVVKMGDLRNDNTMKAIDLFEHAGGAAHPNDMGMLNKLKELQYIVIPGCTNYQSSVVVQRIESLKQTVLKSSTVLKYRKALYAERKQIAI